MIPVEQHETAKPFVRGVGVEEQPRRVQVLPSTSV